MIQSTVFLVECEVAEVRVRAGWRGRLILQVRHRNERRRIFGEPEDAGLGPWRDADWRRPDVLAQVIGLLPPNKQ